MKAGRPSSTLGSAMCLVRQQRSGGQLRRDPDAVCDDGDGAREGGLERSRSGRAEGGVEGGEHTHRADVGIDVERLDASWRARIADAAASPVVQARGNQDPRVDARAIGSHPLVRVEHGHEQAADLVRAAPGKDGDGRGVRRHPERGPRCPSVERPHFLRRVADVVRVDPEVAPDLLFERQHDRHAVEALAQRRPALTTPRPHLGRPVPEHANAGVVEPWCQPGIELGVVDEEGGLRPAITGGVDDRAPCRDHTVSSSRGLTYAERGPSAKVAHKLDVSRRQGRAAEPEDAHAGKAADDGRGRAIAGGFSGDDEERAHPHTQVTVGERRLRLPRLAPAASIAAATIQATGPVLGSPGAAAHPLLCGCAH